MKLHIVKIGNSRGIRIPKPLLEQTGLEGEVEVVVRDRTIVIRHVHRTRAAWAESFQEMAIRRDDALSDDDPTPPNSFDEEEWEW
jgi:antitoxin MazE